MKNNLIFILLFLNSILISICVVHNWNFDESAINLLSESDSVSIKVIDETKTIDKDKLRVKLYKYIAKENGEVVYRKYLNVDYNDVNLFNGEVPFDKIESFHRFGTDNIICPQGKFHPIFYTETDYYSLNLTSFTDNGDWELKCQIQETVGFFVVFYLMNGQSHLFFKKSGSSNWNTMVAYPEIYGVKLSKTFKSNYEYPIVSVVK